MLYTRNTNIQEQATKLAMSRARSDRLVRELQLVAHESATNGNFVAERALNKNLLQRIHELETKLQHDSAETLKLIDVAGEGKVFEELLRAKEQEAER